MEPVRDVERPVVILEGCRFHTSYMKVQPDKLLGDRKLGVLSWVGMIPNMKQTYIHNIYKIPYHRE